MRDESRIDKIFFYYFIYLDAPARHCCGPKQSAVCEGPQGSGPWATAIPFSQRKANQAMDNSAAILKMKQANKKPPIIIKYTQITCVYGNQNDVMSIFFSLLLEILPVDLNASDKMSGLCFTKALTCRWLLCHSLSDCSFEEKKKKECAQDMEIHCNLQYLTCRNV